MSLRPDPAVRPDLFGQLAASDPFQRRSRRLFERGQVTAVHGNEADLSLGRGARNNPLELKAVPIVSGYVPQVGDWVAIRYEAGHSGAPWVVGPSMAADASADSVGIGVFAVSAVEPPAPQKSTVYFDDSLRVWRGWNGTAWVDFVGSAVLHNSMPDLQGGAAGQYYHFSASEHDGLQDFLDGSYLAAGYVERLYAKWGPGQAVHATRESVEVSIGSSAILSKHKTSGDMVDGFGAGYLFAIEDSAGAENLTAGIYGVRNGADDTGAISLRTAVGGVLGERMRITGTAVTVNGSIIPGSDSTYDLGAPTAYWRYGYFDRMYLNSTVYLDGSTPGWMYFFGAGMVRSLTHTQFRLMQDDANQRTMQLWIDTTNNKCVLTSTFGSGGAYPLHIRMVATDAVVIGTLGQVNIGTSAAAVAANQLGVDRLLLRSNAYLHGGVDGAVTAVGNLDASTGKLREGGSDLIPAATANGCMFVGWSGLIANIPAGWQLCDGTNNTPDLRGKFIVGADAASGGSYAPGSTGGAATVTLTTAQLPSHSHSATCQSGGAHVHGYQAPGSTNAWATGGGGHHHTSGSTESAGSHAHTITIDAAGSGQAHENRPPYYAACWIGRVR